MRNKIYILIMMLLGISHNSFSQVDVTEVFSTTELTYQGDVSTSDLLTGITPSTSGPAWSTAVAQLTDGVHGDTYSGAGNAVQGAWTTVGSTAEYDLGTGTNGTGYNLTSIVSIADWESAGYGNQGWTIEVQPVGGAYTTLYTVAYEPITAAIPAPAGKGTTKVVLTSASGIVATGIEKIKITANQVNGGLFSGKFVWRELDVFGDSTPANCESSLTQLTYQGDVSTSDLLTGITPTTTGWNTGNGATVAQLTDGFHGAAGLPVEGAWTTVGATATYDLGIGPNGTGYDLNSIVSIADWESAGFGNQKWTIEVQPVGGSFTTLLSGDCQSLGATDAGTTKVIEGDGSAILASGIQKIRITANSVNGGANAGAFVWRELDVFGVATPPNCDFSLTPLTYQGDVSNSDLLVGIIPSTTGWNTTNGASVSQLTDGVHGDDFTVAGDMVEGAWTTVGATATYALGLGDNGTGYDLTSIVSIADWVDTGFGNQSWTIEVQPVGGAYTTLHTGDCQPLGVGPGTTKVVVGDGSATLASGIQNIRITANAVNGGGFVWRELDVFGVSTTAVSCVLKIMPMGDSITAGYTDNPTWSHQFNFGYRSDLYTLLVDSGIDVQYMGSSTEPWASPFPGDPTNGGTNMPDPDLRVISQDNHHGYGGQTASYLNANIASWLAAEEPEIILLKIGTNSQDTGGLNTLVNYITTNKPDINIIVAQIMPKINYQAGIVNYNNYIKNTMVPAYQALGKNVTTVDLYAPFLTDPGDLTSIDTSLFSNGINHPNAAGYNLMAHAWQIAINDLGISGCVDPCLNGATTEFIGGSWNNGSPDSSFTVIIKDDYITSSSGGSIDACNIIIQSGKTLTIAAGDYLNVEGNITVDGNLVVEHTGNLVQVDDGALVINNGSIAVNLTTPSLNARDFMIMGSPMTAEDDAMYSAYQVLNHTTANFTPYVGDPPVVGVNFHDQEFDDWSNHTGVLTPGEGYLVRPSYTSGGTYNYVYDQGTLNNGVVTYPAEFGDNKEDSPNVLSNPYASAIDADLFIGANPIVDEVYFWEHLTTPAAGIPGPLGENFSMEDISMYNLSGGTPAANGGGTPNDVISTGQGFGIKANSAGDVTFNNSMRLTSGNTTLRRPIEKDLIWLTVRDSQYHMGSTTLIGFMETATSELDEGYDSMKLGTVVSLYSHLEDGSELLGIQGRESFDVSKQIPMGFSTMIDPDSAIPYTISISDIEGSNIEQATVYLVDHLENTITNLSESDYTFLSDAATYDNRFTLQFESEVILGTQENDLEQISIYPNPTHDVLTIVSTRLEVTSVIVYDVRGRVVAENLFTTQGNYQIDLSKLETALYFVEITTENGTLTKRVLKQ
jgi:lysophospholipase L1-like esterase